MKKGISLVLILAVIISGILISASSALGSPAPASSPSPFLDGYTTRRLITIDHTRVGGATLTNFPVLVRLNATNFDFNKSMPNGHDIRFTAADGTTLLAFERERHDAAAGLAEYHVRIPSVSHTAPTIFFIYQRTAPTTDGANATAVWDANTMARWSLSENPAGVAPQQMRDSTVNINHGTTHGAMALGQSVEGRIGRALRLDGVDDRVEIPHSVSLDFERTNSISMEAWIKTAATGVHAIASKMMPVSPHTGYDLIVVNGRLRFHLINTWPGNSLAEDSVVAVNDNVWRHIVITYDGLSTSAGLRFYIDGVEVSTTITQDSLTASIRNTLPFTIGSRQATHLFSGIIDEIRMSNIARSPAWITASFNSGAGTLLSVGAEDAAPTVIINSTAPNPTNVSPIPMTATFSEPVTTFVAGDITVTNGNVTTGSFTGTGAVYNWTVTPNAAGLVTVNITAGVAHDLAGNPNTAAPTFNITFDNVAPTIIINPVISPTNLTNQTITGTVEDSFTVTMSSTTAGTTFGAVTINTTPSPDTWSVLATLIEGTNNITATTSADAAGNINTTTTTIVRDTIAPTITITSPAPDPTNVSPIPMTTTFSEPVIGFEVGDITVTNGAAANLTTTNNITFNFTVTPIAQGGVTVNITAGVAHDLAGNPNTASPTFNITFDNVAPTITINPVISPTNLTTQTVNGTMEANATVTLSSATATFGAVSYPTATTWSVVVTLIEGSNNITANATDTAGNTNTTTTTIVRDTVPPTFVSSTPSSGAVINNFATLLITMADNVRVNEAGTTITATIDGAAFANFTRDNTIANQVTVTLTPPVADGVYAFTITPRDVAGNTSVPTIVTITMNTVAPAVAINPVVTPTNVTTKTITGTMEAGAIVAATSTTLGTTFGAVTTLTPTTWSVVATLVEGRNNITITATDAAGNVGADTAIIVRDTVPPAVTLASIATDPTNVSPIPMMANLSEPVTGFDAGDITVTNGAVTAGSFTGGPTVFTFTVTPAAQGLVTMDIAAGVATDTAGNPNTAAPAFNIIFDNVAPTVAITQVVSPTNLTTQTIAGIREANFTVTMSSTTVTTFGNVIYPTATTWSVVATLIEGSNNITATTSADAAGNINTTTATIVRDVVAPAFTASTPASGAVIDNFATLVITMADNIDVDEPGTIITATRDGAAFIAFTRDNAVANQVTVTVTAPVASGVYVFTIRPRDVAGNFAVATTTVTITVVPPPPPPDPGVEPPKPKIEDLIIIIKIPPNIIAIEETVKIEKIEEGIPIAFEIKETNITRIKIITIEDETNIKFRVQELTKLPIGIPKIDNIYQNFSIVTNIKSEDIFKATIEFNVSKSWINENNISLDTIRLNRFNKLNNTWDRLFTEMIGKDGYNITFSAITPHFFVFAITGEVILVPPPPPVKVPPPPPPVITGIRVTLNIAETQQFTASPIPEGAVLGEVTWSVDNEAVGTIDANGFFTARAAGITTIRAEYAGITGTAIVTVIEPSPVIPGFGVLLAIAGLLAVAYLVLRSRKRK